MARAILTVVLVVLLNVLVGCADMGNGGSKLILGSTKQSLDSDVALKFESGEVDIVEQMAVNRRAYKQGLVALGEHYTKVGNNMKLTWAHKELARLDKVPQYNYIIEASLAGPALKATTSIPRADRDYMRAVAIENKARTMLFFVDGNKLRQALDTYNQLIRNYPTSDKIDDAAYKAGRIYEALKEYSIALLYYQRAYQWDPDTIHPAMFKAARVLDRKLHRRDEALELYKEAVKSKELSGSHREFTERRIAELTRSGESSK